MNRVRKQNTTTNRTAHAKKEREKEKNKMNKRVENME